MRLIEAGECENAVELLKTLDDQIVKDIEAELDQESEEKMDEAEIAEPDEQIKQFLRDFLLDIWANIVVALQLKGSACFEQVIQRHVEKLLKLQEGK